MPGFVARELRAYLGCGQLQSGFARVYCPGCRREELVRLDLLFVHQHARKKPPGGYGKVAGMKGVFHESGKGRSLIR